MRTRILVSAGLLALCALPLAAQDAPWSLSDCIGYALEHNLTVQQNALSVQQKEIELNTAKSRYLPGVSASASENFSFGRGLTADNTYTNSNTSSTSFSLGGELPLFQGFDIINGVKIAKLDLASATADLEKARDDIRVSVAQAYVQILYNEELLKVASQQTAHDAELLEQVEAKRLAGKASDADVSAQRATLAQSRLSETQASNNLVLSKLDLTQLLELPSPEGFEVVSPDVSSLELQLLMTPEEIYAVALGIRPAVQAAQIQLESAEVSVDKAKGGYLPSLSLSGGIGTNYYTTSNVSSPSFGEQLRNNFSQYVGLSLSVPIFSRFSTRNSVRTAQINRSNMQLQLESVRKSLYKEIQQAYYNAVASQAKYSSSAESALSAEQHYELTEQKYLNGKASITDYNDAKNSRLQAESEYLKARYECLFQTRLLDFYKGGEIVF